MLPLLLTLGGCFLFPDLASDLGLSPVDATPTDGLDPDPACEDYLACIGEVEPGSLSQLVATYGGSGSCWSDEATAATCASACERELERLLDENPEEPACGGTAPPVVDWPFQDGRWAAEVTDVEVTELAPQEDAAGCGSIGGDMLDYVNELLASSGVTFTRDDHEFPDFRFVMLLSSQDCTLDGKRYACSGESNLGTSSGDATEAEMSGKFDERTHTTAILTSGDEWCSVTMTLELNADPAE